VFSLSGRYTYLLVMKALAVLLIKLMVAGEGMLLTAFHGAIPTG
jgi:hypothetical protein